MGVYSIKKIDNGPLEPLRESYIINEATNKDKPERKYKCPYCEVRDTRANLVYHINEEHEEMIPEGFTSSRLVFNYVNKKEFGRCIQCKKETKWDEKVWKYERICSKKCNEEYVKVVKSRMVGKYGKEHILDDPEQQKKMLSNRAISGEYKFKDGGIRSYCGTYEKKLLEFYDKVLEVHSKDIITPGPIVEYSIKGVSRKWITDIYYVPANLVHDVKDGGDNPNNRQMDDYRDKQIAKEKAIEKLNEYNYIRLTDNNFQQLILLLMELKENMMDNKESFITRINESSATAGVIANSGNSNNAYIVPCYMNNTFVGSAMTTDKYMKDIYFIKDSKVRKGKIEDLEECSYTMYKYMGDDVEAKLLSILGELESPQEVDDDYFYTELSGKTMISADQLDYDELFEETVDGYTESVIKKDIIEESLKHQFRELTNDNCYVPLTHDRDIQDMNKLLSDFDNIVIMSDVDGYFGYNHVTETRTRSYNKIDKICSSVAYLDRSKI